MDFNKVVITGYIANEHDVKEIEKNDKSKQC